MDESNIITKISIHTCYVRILRKSNVNGYVAAKRSHPEPKEIGKAENTGQKNIYGKSAMEGKWTKVV